METVPLVVAKALSACPDGLVLPARFHDGHGLDPVTFYPLNDVELIAIYVDVDEYIENYGDSCDQLSGNYYPIMAIDFLKEVPGYNAKGVFVWLPAIGEFGSFDTCHGVLRTFPGVAWTAILESPEKYINCQWHPDRVVNHLLRPWDDSRFSEVVPTKQPNW